MDFDARGSDSGAMSVASPSKCNEFKKCCTDCHTTRTPCWRGGPAGPRTLCNACGIRYRKKKRGLEKGSGAEKKGTKITNKASTNNTRNREFGVSLKMGLMSFDRLLQEECKRKLGEEERAAMLLMTLSCGSAYA